MPVYATGVESPWACQRMIFVSRGGRGGVFYWLGQSIHVCHTSYFTSYFMLLTSYFVISHRAHRGRRDSFVD